jgi:hypothetical protein
MCDSVNEQLLAGTANLLVAEQYGFSRFAVHRHKQSHLHLPMARAAEAAVEMLPPETAQARLKRAEKVLQLTRGCNLVEHLEGLRADAKAIQRGAERNGDRRTALLAIRELVRSIDVHGRITGELANSNVNVAVGVGVNGPLTIAMIDEILRERADLMGTDDPWQQFNRVTEGFTREDYEALWTWCRNRLSSVLDSPYSDDLTADGAEGQAKPEP